MKRLSFLFLVFIPLIVGQKTEYLEVNLHDKKEVILSCDGLGSFFFWYNSTGGGDFEITYDPRVDFDTLETMKIRELTLADDRSSFTCKDPLTDLEKEKELTILKKFNLRVIDEKPTDPPVMDIEWKAPEGEFTFSNEKPIVIDCRAGNKDAITKAFRIDDNGKMLRYRQAAIVIHRPKAFNSGKYLCTAELNGQFFRKEITIIVRVDGGLSNWLPWEPCNAECGYGVQVRKKTCTNPAPANGGRDCYGKREESRRCRTRSCSTPRFTRFGFDLRDGDLKLHCNAKGIPTPTTEWKYKGRPLPSSYNPTSGTATIPASRKRSGVYSCTIRNNVGFFTMSIDIRL